MLAAVAVHAHYHAVLVLHAHLVVNVLLNAAAEKALQIMKDNMINHDDMTEKYHACLFYQRLVLSYLAAFTCMDTIVEP